MRKADAYITEESFGSILPANWRKAAAILNEEIDALEENEFGEVDQDEVCAIWENYCESQCGSECEE